MKVESVNLRCYKAGMGRKKVSDFQKKSEVIGVTATPATKEEIIELAERQERSISWIGGALLKRGLAAYKRDGLLIEPEENNETATPLQGVHNQGREKIVVRNRIGGKPPASQNRKTGNR